MLRLRAVAGLRSRAHVAVTATRRCVSNVPSITTASTSSQASSAALLTSGEHSTVAAGLPPVQGPLTLDQAQQLATDPGLRTIPVPVLVGPTSPELPEVSEVLTVAQEAATKPATAGGFFFGKPMAFVEWILTGVHDTTALPWWATIAVTTATVRLAFVPFQIYQSRSIAKMALIKPQMDALNAQMRAGGAKGTDKGIAEAEEARKALSVLFARHNLRPWMSIVGAVTQLPLWITFFFTIRHMTRPDGGLGLDTGGVLWFTDLTAKDPYFVLPVLCGTTFFGMVHLGDGGQAPGAPVDPKQAMMRQMMKGVAVIMVPTTAWFESGVFVYWISTNTFAMMQARAHAHLSLQRRAFSL
jgi:YidC/Oxa1 family membrane protein insertase